MPSARWNARSFVLLVTVGAGLGAVVTMSSSACVLPGDDADASADGSSGACGAQTCTEKQVCLYRECSYQERCKPSTTCPAGTTPADCNGTPGCLVTNCAPVVSGCRDIPESCGGDVTCACGSICGSPSACSKVDGRNALCAGS